MSKKIMKRSLALGALMAFVITGSAMAAGESYNKQIITSSDCKEISNATDGGSKEYGAITDDLTYVGEAGKVTIQTNYNNSSITLKGNTLNVTTNVADVVLTTSGTNDSKISLTADKSIKISGLVIGNGNNNTIGLEAGTDIEVTGGIKTYGGSNNITLRATNGCIKTTGIVETNAPKSNIELIGNSVEIVATVADAIKTYGSSSEIAVKGTNGTTVNGHVIIDGGATGSSIIVGDGGDTTIKGDVKTWGEDSQITIDGGNTTEINGWVVAYGDGSNITLSSNENLNVNGVVQAFSYQQDNAVTNKIRVDMNAKNIVVDAKGFDNAVYTVCDFWKPTSDEAVINLGNDSTDKIEIKNFNNEGLFSAYEGSGIIVKANELKIYSDKEESVGIYVANGTYEGNWGNKNTENNARVLIGKNTVTTIDVKDTAIVAMSEGVVDIKGDLTAIAKNAILARGNATVNINDDGQGNSLGSTVVLNGDIAFDYDGVTSQTPVDANVNVNLDGKGSGFSGKIYVTGEGFPAGFNEVKNMNISLSNDATWNLTGASVVNQATFGKDAVLILKKGSAFEATKDTEGNATTGGNYALNAGGGNANKLTIDHEAKLQIGGIQETTYNIAQGFANYDDVADKIDIADNALLQANKKVTGNYYQVEIKAKEAEQMATEMGVSSSTAQSIANVTTAAQNANVKGNAEGTGDAKSVALVEAMAKVDSKVAGQAYEAVTKMAEAGGNSGTAASIVKNVTGVTNDRLSFNCGHSAPHKGGHGVGLLEEGSGADIWVEYVHGKDEVEDMPSTAGATSYEGKYNGIVMGVDFKKVNKFQSGIAFNYGEGDTNSVGTSARTRSDYDFWGIGYYGNIHNDDSNVIFDVSYAKTDSDVETDVLGINYKASPETTTWTAGVKVEKLYQNENVQIVPYTGLRFMSIDPEDYSTKCASTRYQMERQNVWLLPLGVSIRQEVTNDNGWIVSPRVDLSYIWAFGDTDSEMEFSTLGTKTNVGYEVMDDGSFLGLVGIEAHKGQWGFGVSYSYQKGDYSTSKKWFVDLNYSF